MSDVSRETRPAPEGPGAPAWLTPGAPAWLTIVGVGDDGPEGLSPAARAVIQGARCVVGGRRLLERCASLWAGAGEAVAEIPSPILIPWSDLEGTVAAIVAQRGQPTVVIATGDPMHFGLGSTLARDLAASGIAREEWTVIAAPGAFSLAAARMGWAVQDCRCLTVHGRPLETLRLQTFPGQKLLVLSADGASPRAVAQQLVHDGYGPSAMSVLCHLGGTEELCHTTTADDLAQQDGDWPALNSLAIECRLAAGLRPLSCASGLPDQAFEHDGQITKQEIRAVTLSALAPWPGAHLWDVGSGSGSIAIEWMRAAPSATALAIEQDGERAARIGRNALALGVPALQVLVGKMPGVLSVLCEDDPRVPDVIFVGGGVSHPHLLERLMGCLPPGGRLVANAVTLQAERAVMDFQAVHGGTLRRIAVSRLAPIGSRFDRWEPLAPVTQLCVENV